MNIGFKVDMEGQRKKTATLKRLPEAQRRLIQVWAGNAVKAIRQNLRGRFLKVNTGKLWRSIGRKFTRKGEASEVIIGTNVSGARLDVPYAKAHEEGETIVPRNKQWLTIPLAGYKGTAANIPKDKSFFLRTITGNLLLCEKTGKTGKAWKARFMLVKSVRLPARRWFTKSLREQMPELAGLMSADRVWQEAERSAAKAEEA
ncbi:MAG: HK97 gp10 family phage protein [Acidobacteria bacterium]|nr:HK97 gp10 family phage protein [Acidobacteriota bacterium]